jgi:hypothetical protein
VTCLTTKPGKQWLCIPNRGILGQRHLPAGRSFGMPVTLNENSNPEVGSAVPTAFELRQRRRMLIALAVLLAALVVVIIKDRQFWFPPNPESTEVEPATPAPSTEVQAPAAPAPNAIPATPPASAPPA